MKNDKNAKKLEGYDAIKSGIFDPFLSTYSKFHSVFVHSSMYSMRKSIFWEILDLCQTQRVVCQSL